MLDLTVNLFLTLLIEIPLIGFFFRSKKRNKAYLAAFIINIIVWPLVNIVILNTNLYDKASLFNPMVQIPVILVEAVFYRFFLKSPLKKVMIMALAANILSIVATYYIKIPHEIFLKKDDTILRQG